jgi:hypothetical protein
MDNLRTYEIVYNEDLIITEIALVDAPAMKAHWVALAETKSEHKDAMKQTLTSAVIIPDLPIRRQDPVTGEFFNIVYRKEVIEKLAQDFIAKGNTKVSNINHTDQKVDAQLTELWIKTDENCDKSNALGFNLPVGTMFASYKVNDKQVWDEKVMTGELNGFSLEALHDAVETKLSEVRLPELDAELDDAALLKELEELDLILGKLLK